MLEKLRDYHHYQDCNRIATIEDNRPETYYRYPSKPDLLRF